jgi:multidrug resistance protein
MDRHSRAFAVWLVTLSAFTDILCYSVAVPVLPDLSRQLGASPTTIGFLFGSFGVTLLAVSVPAGAWSDRRGRRGLLLGGAIALAAATVLFAFARSLPLLFLARLVQGAADAVTWVVGFALIADLYDADERGRVMGLVMSGTTVGFMLGPSIGGLLYESVGPSVPYLVVAALAVMCAAGLIWMAPPPRTSITDETHLTTLLRVPAVAVCSAAVLTGSGTLSMLEPTVALFLADHIGLRPAGIGLVWGTSAVVSAMLHPVFGRIADRVGGRRLMFAGLFAMTLTLPALSLSYSFGSAVLVNGIFTVGVSMMVTPSLAYMADATASAGVRSYGVAYGIYNFAWATGLLAGPVIGGAAYERIGFIGLTTVWSAGLLACTLMLARAARAGRAITAL